jgi:hypothetical protein
MEKTTFFWLAINYATTTLLCFIITLALIGEWLVRKLFGVFSPKPYQPPVRETTKAVTQS